MTVLWELRQTFKWKRVESRRSHERLSFLTILIPLFSVQSLTLFINFLVYKLFTEHKSYIFLGSFELFFCLLGNLHSFNKFFHNMISSTCLPFNSCTKL